ncbi:hypothetical protein EUTSA_v10000723mg [Eutrema salsugineum]|uniref:Myb-like domain-containing protein n=1 Tax=Eutrema salsugineum TaxID=72664 RepID=V4LR40_EUTSA|nr:hypothetical protein EUTSA_v10000723mg [Eutrema salsugineum]
MAFPSSGPSFPSSNFVELLNSQQDSVFCGYASSLQEETPLYDASFGEASPATEKKERRQWSPSDDLLLISSWLNTGKDAVVGNEQKSTAFWKRIAAFFSASLKSAGREKIESIPCKQRWQKINDQVCKFCGAYAAACRERASGQKHAWYELKNDQKWSELSTHKAAGNSKKKKRVRWLGAEETQLCEEDNVSKRPAGVKASKAKAKKVAIEKEEPLEKLQAVWQIQEKDLAMKANIKKMGILECLLAKQGPLSDYEEDLKKKLITELF